MKIKQTGSHCLSFSLSSPYEKRKRVEIVICQEQRGEVQSLRVKSDILILTKGLRDDAIKSGPETFVIIGPGEYEIQGVFIQGLKIDAKAKGVVYAIGNGDLIACYLEGENWRELEPEELEKIGDIDVLVVPVEKGKGFSGKEIREAVSQIEPKLVVLAMRSASTKKSIIAPEFLKEMRVKSLETQSELVIKKEDLKEEGRKIIALMPENR